MFQWSISSFLCCFPLPLNFWDLSGAKKGAAPGGAEGQLLVSSAAGRIPVFGLKSLLVLIPFSIDLNLILFPKMVPKSVQRTTKTEPRGTKTQSSIAKTIQEPIWEPPGRNFHRYGAPAGGGFGAQNRPKSFQKWILKLILFWNFFFIDFGSQNGQKNGPKIDQDSVPKISSLKVILKAILNASSSFRTSQIVLGDRYGATCAPEIISDLIKLISKNGLRASRNIPFSGAYIVQKYGSPGLNRHAIQLEIDRSIYMDERKIQKLEKFHKLKNKLQNIMRDFSQIHTCLTSIAAE